MESWKIVNIVSKITKVLNKGTGSRNDDEIIKYYEMISMTPICTEYKLGRDLRKYSVIYVGEEDKMRIGL